MDETARAAGALADGGVVVLPTDTVYGLAVRPDLPRAIEKVFALKGRPREKALPILGGGVEDLEGVAAFDARARTLASAFWPGPLTIVLPRRKGFDVDLGGDAGITTVAVRVPAAEPTLTLLGVTGPLAVTSANHSGSAPALTVADARATFGEAVAIYLDGGRTKGEPSTVVSLAGELKVLRRGPLEEADLEECLRA